MAGLVPPGVASAAARGRLPGVFDLSMRTIERFRPFDLIAPEFVQVDTAVPPRTLASTDALVVTDQRPRAPFCAVTVEVTSLSPDGRAVAGLAAAGGDGVVVAYSASSGEMTVEVTRGGTTTVVDRTAVALRTPFQLGFVLNENAVTGLADPTGTGDAFAPQVTERNAVRALVDLRVPAELGRHSYAYGGQGATLGRVRAGYFGMAGLRDPHLVQHADGRPYERDGRYFMTFTCAGLGFFQQAHWGVFAFDPEQPDRLEQVSQLFFERDGVVLGDHAGQVVWDDRSREWIVGMSSWGDFSFAGVHVRYVRTSADVLSGVHVLPTARLPLPTDVSQWDPSFTRIEDRWHVAFVESPSQTPFQFHPALAVGARRGSATEGLERVGADLTVDATEGTILQEVGGTWYLLASDGDARQYRVYDLAVRYLGTLDAPYGSNIPHPQLVPVGRGRRGVQWIMITFDGTQYADDTTRDIAQLAADADVFRFDGSDLMPAEVGSGSFWTGMVDWMSGASSQEALDAIEASWPAS